MNCSTDKKLNMRFSKTFLLLFITANVFAQGNIIDSVIQNNRYILKIENGKLAGSGTGFLTQTAGNCQFIVLGEEHNTYEIPIFTTALFSLLQQTNGFQYLALEQDPVRSRIISQQGYRGNRDSAFSLIKQFPFSYSFATDQEVEMMAYVSGLSKGRGRPVWGCDQSFGVVHVLRELMPYAPGMEAKKFTSQYMKTAWKYENSRDNEKHFMSQVCREEDIKRLRELYKPAIKNHADWLLHTLEVSERVYENYFRGERGIPGGYYLNGYEREEYMKERFMEEYNHAAARDKKIPRVLLKFGQWHVMNGFGPSKLNTTGNFVRALAKTNGLQSFYISMSLFEHPDSLAVRSSSALSLIAKHCNANEWTLIDLRPLRVYSHFIRKNKLIQNTELLQEFQDFIFRNDAVLLFGNKRMGTYEWKNTP